jgi:hypothetical protein
MGLESEASETGETVFYCLDETGGKLAANEAWSLGCMSYPPGFTARAVWSSSILVADSHFLSEHIVIVAIIVVDSRFLALWLPF